MLAETINGLYKVEAIYQRSPSKTRAAVSWQRKSGSLQLPQAAGAKLNNPLSMELRQLRYFVTIADLGSMSRASEALYIAQSALSKQIAQLETELGQPLLTRTPTGVRPTEQGAVFYTHAQRVLREIDDIRTTVSSTKNNPSGRVSVGFPQSTAAQYALPLVEESGRRYPAIRLEIFDEVGGNIMKMLASGRFDFGIIVNEEDAALLDSVPLVDEELFLISRADMAPRSELIDAADLVKLPMFLPAPGQGSRTLLDAFLAEQGSTGFQLPVLINSVNIMRQAILSGIAHAVMPLGAVSEEMASGKFSAKALTPKVIRRVYVSKARGVSLSLAGQAIHDLMIGVARERVANGSWPGVTLV